MELLLEGGTGHGGDEEEAAVETVKREAIVDGGGGGGDSAEVNIEPKQVDEDDSKLRGMTLLLLEVMIAEEDVDEDTGEGQLLRPLSSPK